MSVTKDKTEQLMNLTSRKGRPRTHEEADNNKVWLSAAVIKKVSDAVTLYVVQKMKGRGLWVPEEEAVATAREGKPGQGQAKNTHKGQRAGARH